LVSSINSTKVRLIKYQVVDRNNNTYTNYMCTETLKKGQTCNGEDE